MKVQLVTPYRMSHMQCYGVTIRGNVTNVDPPLRVGCLVRWAGMVQCRQSKKRVTKWVNADR